MKHYALLFRASRTLTPEELKQRTIDIQLWVKHVTEMGVTLDPRSLGETATRFSIEGGTVVSHEVPSDTALGGPIVFFDSPSKEQAMEIARIHPGLRYGVSVELREWSAPRPPAARP